MKTLLTALMLTYAGAVVSGQQEIPLYNGEIPGSRDPGDNGIIYNRETDGIAYNVSVPTLTVFLPPAEKASGAAVVICPGGGYRLLVIEREGRKIAHAFNRKGVAAFVLRYRLPDDNIMDDKSAGPLQDAQKAIKVVREHAKEWNIDPDKTGIMGFSAGGHLASTAGTHFNKNYIENIKGTSLRPDFMILVYPVISFSDTLGHLGSRENLLGKAPSEQQVLLFSNDRQVSVNTPPAFMILAGDDSVVKPENSLAFYSALKRNGIPAEIHIYQEGEHGFISEPPFDEWFGRCCFWMETNGWM
jgi:acetyl esterase/lipase